MAHPHYQLGRKELLQVRMVGYKWEMLGSERFPEDSQCVFKSN